MKGDETTHDEISTALRAVVAAVSSMEDDGAFNAGYGSALTEDGTVEMDAGVMEGTGIRSGAVAAIGKCCATYTHHTTLDVPSVLT